MGFSLLFFMLRLCSTISMPFFLSYIISGLTDQSQEVSVWSLILIIICYKMVSSVIWTLCDFLYTDLGIEVFAYLQWLILGSESLSGSDIGKAVNIIEYDCTLISGIIYSTMTTFFYCLELAILFGLLIKYLLSTEPFYIFALIICGYVVCQGLVSFGVFKFNKIYINEKDRRLETNFNEDNGQMLKQR